MPLRHSLGVDWRVLGQAGRLLAMPIAIAQTSKGKLLISQSQ